MHTVTDRIPRAMEGNGITDVYVNGEGGVSPLQRGFPYKPLNTGIPSITQWGQHAGNPTIKLGSIQWKHQIQTPTILWGIIQGPLHPPYRTSTPCPLPPPCPSHSHHTVGFHQLKDGNATVVCLLQSHRRTVLLLTIWHSSNDEFHLVPIPIKFFMNSFGRTVSLCIALLTYKINGFIRCIEINWLSMFLCLVFKLVQLQDCNTFCENKFGRFTKILNSRKTIMDFFLFFVFFKIIFIHPL